MFRGVFQPSAQYDFAVAFLVPSRLPNVEGYVTYVIHNLNVSTPLTEMAGTCLRRVCSG